MARSNKPNFLHLQKEFVHLQQLAKLPVCMEHPILHIDKTKVAKQNRTTPVIFCNRYAACRAPRQTSSFHVCKCRQEFVLYETALR